MARVKSAHRLRFAGPRTHEAHARELLVDALQPALWDRVLEIEPRPFAAVGAVQQRAAAELLADFADLKSTWMLGHSRAVAQRVRAAALAVGATPEEQQRLETAALVHDLGRVAVSNALWDKPGAYTRGEWKLVRTHAFHTDRIVALISGVIGEVSGLASLAHERLDASGYHRGLAAAGLNKWARLLAAADVAQALSEARPHRAAFPRDAAAKLLRELAAQGGWCARATDVILAADGGAVETRSAATSIVDAADESMAAVGKERPTWGLRPCSRQWQRARLFGRRSDVASASSSRLKVSQPDPRWLPGACAASAARRS